MAMIMPTRRRVLQTAALAASGLAGPVYHRVAAAAEQSGMTLAWHTNIAPRWLDPLQHDGSATGDNFLNIVQDALIKNTSNSTMASRSHQTTSNGPTSIITAPGRRCYTT
jgi:hypothetical protein